MFSSMATDITLCLDTAAATEVEEITLIDLPTEILFEIMQYIMDCHQLIALRMTCKALCIITQSRDLWLKMMAHLITASHVHPPEEEIDIYTTVELEKWVIQRSLVRDTISGVIRAKPRCHSVQMPIDYVLPNRMTSQILPGGRWLLLFGFVSCHVIDLDSHDRTPKLLFDPAEFNKGIIERGGGLAVGQVYWINYGKERLSFRVATHYTDTIRLCPLVHIHEVELVGHGRDATLVAKHVTSFYHPENVVASYFLNGSYYVEVRILEGSLRFRVFHYSPTIGSSRTGMMTLDALQVTIEGGDLDLLLLARYIYGNMFVIATELDYIDIHKIVCDADTNPLTIQHLHMISFKPQTLRNISPFRVLNGSCWITRTWEKEWHRIEIPHDGTEPRIEFLGEVLSDVPVLAYPRNANRVVVDISSSLIFTDTGDLQIINHLSSSSGGLHSYFIPFQLPITLNSLQFISYSQDTGRIVFYSPNGGKTIFVDLTNFGRI